MTPTIIDSPEAAIRAVERRVAENRRQLQVNQAAAQPVADPLSLLSVEQLEKYIAKEAEYRDNVATCKTCAKRRDVVISESMKRTERFEALLAAKLRG